MNTTFLIFLFIASGVISFFLLKCIQILWKKWKIMDRPHLYKSEMWRPPAPYSAGIVIFLTLFLLSPLIVYFGNFSENLLEKFWIIMIIGWLLNIISFIDDLDTIGKSPVKIPPIFRLLMQILVGLVIGLTSIKISYISGIFGGIFNLSDAFWQYELFGISFHVFPILVTILWYVLIFNSVNFSDGIPGITGGFALISFFILAFLAVKLFYIDTTLPAQENSRFLLTILAVLIPVTFFLTRFDISRKVIMGDTGTLTLAFFIATLAIIAGWKIATTLSVLGVYIIDAIYVIMIRLKRRQNPMKWDQSTHLHFRLMEIGLSKNQVRGVVYFLTAIFGISAILLSTYGKIMLLIVIAAVTIFLTEIITLVQTKHNKKWEK